jgi:hypothetical protein
LGQIAKENSYYFDLNHNNFMIRSNGELVINDPFHVESDTNSKLQPEALHESKNKTISHFLSFCCKKLNLDKGKLPEIKFSDDTLDVRKHHRMGYYDPEKNIIWIYIENRNMADILRTLAHELVHTQQRFENRIGTNTAPDSDIEKEADMVAGQIMKQYGIINRQIYD